MARVKIQSKTVKATLANKDVADMFQGVLMGGEGGAEAPLSIAYPKYLRMKQHAGRFIGLLTALHKSRTMEALFPAVNGHLGVYVAALEAQLASSFNALDLEPWIGHLMNYAAVPAAAVAQFAPVFAAAKKCNLVNIILVACKNLVKHKASLQDQAALKDGFLLGAGLSFAPLPDLVQVNFKQIYTDSRLSAAERTFVLMVLHKMLAISHDMYEAVSTPDIDIDEFISVIMSSIDEVKKRIPRCDQAFDKIVDSVGLLKGNFGGYYKDFTASGNPTVIMENFVLDVSKTAKGSPSITAQFRKIIAHYRKLASEQRTNPKLQSLFEQVDANFQALDKATADDTVAASDSDEAGSAAPAGPPSAPATEDEIAAAAANAAATAAARTVRNRRKKVRARARAERKAEDGEELDENCTEFDADGADDAATAAKAAAVDDAAAADDAAVDNAAADNAGADDDAADDAAATKTADMISGATTMLCEMMSMAADASDDDDGDDTTADGDDSSFVAVSPTTDQAASTGPTEETR